MATRYVIIGNGISGISAAQVIRGRDDEASITIIGEETERFYARTALMWIYTGQMTRTETEPFEPWYWRENRFTLIRDRVTAINTAQHELTLGSGAQVGYDRLLLAVGAEANMFGWPGQDLDGVCNMCTMRDLDQLEAVRPRLRRAVVVGGGLIGVELVEMMIHDRIPVTYLIREPWYWEMVLSQQEAEIVHERLRRAGVDLVLEDEIGEILDDGKGRVGQVTTKKGRELPCELVGIAVGVHPRTGLAKAAEIECGRGILVDRGFRTSAPDVFAAGDCAEVRWDSEGPNRIEQLWYTGIKQGRAAGLAMLGDPVRYEPGVPYNSAQFLFLDYLNVGWMNLARYSPPAEILGEDFDPDLHGGKKGLGLAEHFHRASGQPNSIRISHRQDTGQVLGFSMLGSRWNSRVLIRWIRERRALTWVLGQLEQAVYNEEFRKSRFEGRHA